MISKTPPTQIEIEKLLLNDTKVKIAGKCIDVDGVLRSKVMSKDKFLSVIRGGALGFCAILFGWDIKDTTYTRELGVSSRKNGFADLNATIDLSTFRRLPWEKDTPFFLVNFMKPRTFDVPLICDPRNLIASLTEQAASQGYKCMAGVELEYFQFSETPQSIEEKRYSKLTPLTPGMHGYSALRPVLNADYFHALYDEALSFGIPLELHHTETGPGVYESALAYTEACRMADSVTLFKFVAKSVGIKHKVMPTFMAKPYTKLPGTSGHIHMSLRNAKGENIFGVTQKVLESGGRANAYHKDLAFISQEAEWFLAGLIDGIPDIMPLLCPNINSFKRIKSAAEFFIAPKVTYGYDCRNASVRVISPPACPPAGTRFEVRIPGADMIPHYALSALLALGLRGIRKRLTLLCGPVDSPEMDETMVKTLPTSLLEAVKTFSQPQSLAREVLGDEFVDHYAGTREHELDAYEREVSTWEVERYFELV